jgi:hypothetical protein
LKTSVPAAGLTKVPVYAVSSCAKGSCPRAARFRFSSAVLVEYARAYLTAMSERKYWKLIYFDGFAGEGSVNDDEDYVRYSANEILKIDKDAINLAGDLYKERLNSVFQFVSKPYTLRNKTSTIMFRQLRQSS